MKNLAFTLLAAAALLSGPAMMDGSPFKASPAFAKHGADDPAGDDRGGRGRGRDDGPGHTRLEQTDDTLQLARRGRGADDGAGHTRRCRGCDDGPGHT